MMQGKKTAVCPKCDGKLAYGDYLRSRYPMLAGQLVAGALDSECTGATCPACEGQCRLVMRHGVDIDVCVGCHSVWLDPGEQGAVKLSLAQLVRGFGLPHAYWAMHVMF